MLWFYLALLSFFCGPFSIDQRDSLRVRDRLSGNVGFFRRALELLCGQVCRGRWPLFCQLRFLLYVGSLLMSSRLASSRAPGRLTRCSFAARLRCHCCFFKISFMAQASSNGAMLVYDFLPVHCIVDFARLCFVDGENIH